MVKKRWIGLIGLAVMAFTVQAADILVDDFSSGSVGTSARVYETDFDGGWKGAWGPAATGSSEWTITGGQMENSATNTGSWSEKLPAEGALSQVVSHGADTNNVVDISFDYDVAAGDTLYVHLWGLDGTYSSTAGEWIANPQGGNGALPTANHNSVDGELYNLKDGTVASGSAASALVVALTGSGTYTNSFSVGQLAISGVQTAGDFEYYLVGFLKKEDGTAGTTSIDNLSLTTSYVAPPAAVFQENPSFPAESVLVSQLEYNNTGSVKWTGASGGQNTGLGQSFEFASATTLRAITFQKGGTVIYPTDGTNELKLWVGQYDSTTDPSNHVSGTTLYTDTFDVSGQSFWDGYFYTINLPSDLSLSAGVEYAFELAFSSQDASHTFDIKRYYEGAGGADKYAAGTIIYQQNVSGTVPFASLINEPENDMTFALHSAIVGDYVPVAGTFVRTGTDTTWAGVPGWRDNTTGSWTSSTRMPLGIDSVTLNNNGTPDLYADVDASVTNLYMVNNANSATLHMTDDVTLSILTGMHVGSDPAVGTGTVNQAAGLIDVGDSLTVNTKDTYNLTGGDLSVDGHATVKGELNIDGGTFTLNNNNVNISGAGVMKLQSGSFSGSADSSNGQGLQSHIEISGGTFSWLSQVLCTGDAEITVDGDAASITMRHIQTTDAYGSFALTLNYDLNETGVSTITNTSWMFLQNTTINVNGSAYTGGSKDIDLIDGATINGLANPANITVTGFAAGTTAVVVQDTGTGNVRLEITVPGYAGWASEYGLSGSPDADWDYDYDLDGEINFYEYAFGGDPTNIAVKGYVATGEAVDDGGTNFFEYVYARRIGSETELDYKAEFGSNLAIPNWSDADVLELPVTGTIDGNYESVTNRVDMTGKPVGFMKVTVDEL